MHASMDVAGAVAPALARMSILSKSVCVSSSETGPRSCVRGARGLSKFCCGWGCDGGCDAAFGIERGGGLILVEAVLGFVDGFNVTVLLVPVVAVLLFVVALGAVAPVALVVSAL